MQRRRPGRGTVALGFAFLALSLAAETAAARILREPVPDRVVVLTFDDAVVSDATHVAPLLKENGFTVLALRDLARYIDPDAAYRTIAPSFDPR